MEANLWDLLDCTLQKTLTPIRLNQAGCERSFGSGHTFFNRQKDGGNGSMNANPLFSERSA